MPAAEPTRRWLLVTPDRFVIGLLAVEGLLSLAGSLHWFPKGWAVLTAVASVGVAILMLFLWCAASLIFRWRFQFSIRSLLTLMIAVALPFGWLGMEIREADRQIQAVQEIKKSQGGGVGYDWQLTEDHTALSNAPPPGPEWLRNLLGDDFFAVVEGACLGDTQLADAKLEHLLKSLPRLTYLNLKSSPVTNECIEKLKQASPNCRIDH